MGADSALDGALAAARRGWHVFPVGGWREPKAPRPGWRWAERNTTDPATIRAWMGSSTAYGVACGRSRLVIIDLDMPGGDTAFGALCQAHQAPWPVTYTVLTPSGGRHLYFRASPDRQITNSAGRLAPRVDVRANGGYVVGAGSVIAGNGEYRVAGSVRALAPLPGWLAPLCTRPEPRPRDPAEPAGRIEHLAAWVAGQPHGNRNNALFWAACRAVEEGHDPWPLVGAAVDAGHDEARARRTVASAVRGGAR